MYNHRDVCFLPDGVSLANRHSNGYSVYRPGTPSSSNTYPCQITGFNDPEKASDMKSTVDKIVEKNKSLIQSDFRKVVSHVQRDEGEWLVNTLMIEDCDAPFKYKRKKAYKNLTGQRVNLTYYVNYEKVAGIEMEIMKVVRLRIS
jgi:hypothetical protein